MMDDFPEVWDEAAISKATDDLLDLPDLAVVQTLKTEKLGGVNFEWFLNSDPIAAQRFSFYCQRRMKLSSASASRASSAAPSLGVLPALSGENRPQEPEESSAAEPTPKAKPKAKAEGPVAKRARV